MAAMSRNGSSSSLMGFSVHQPALGAPLQFFPAMGSKELDDMIDVYVPGNASILDKRTAVSLEFFDHTIQTGELFKFFLVYTTASNSNTASPASSSALQDSGYGSNFNTSPVVSEAQWSTGASLTPSPAMARSSSTRNVTSAVSRSQPQDFSHLPGMKIMTKDGRDVTNSASRGCKTKEQRDHAHLMRIIKACDACKRKKTRCDPSHKKRSASQAQSPEAKTAKKVKKMAPDMDVPATQPLLDMSSIQFDPSVPIDGNSFSTFDTWDQFIQYDEEPAETIPYDYDFFFDPDGHFSPTTTTSSQVSASQPVTPQQLGDYAANAAPVAVRPGTPIQQPTVPYLAQDGADSTGNYLDFNLYSPGSTCLDDDPGLIKELSASPSVLDGNYSRNRQAIRTQQRSDDFDSLEQSPFAANIAADLDRSSGSQFFHSFASASAESDAYDVQHGTDVRLESLTQYSSVSDSQLSGSPLSRLQSSYGRSKPKESRETQISLSSASVTVSSPGFSIQGATNAQAEPSQSASRTILRQRLRFDAAGASTRTTLPTVSMLSPSEAQDVTMQSIPMPSSTATSTSSQSLYEAAGTERLVARSSESRQETKISSSLQSQMLRSSEETSSANRPSQTSHVSAQPRQEIQGVQVIQERRPASAYQEIEQQLLTQQHNMSLARPLASASASVAMATQASVQYTVTDGQLEYIRDRTQQMVVDGDFGDTGAFYRSSQAAQVHASAVGEACTILTVLGLAITVPAIASISSSKKSNGLLDDVCVAIILNALPLLAFFWLLPSKRSGWRSPLQPSGSFHHLEAFTSSWLMGVLGATSSLASWGFARITKTSPQLWSRWNQTKILPRSISMGINTASMSSSASRYVNSRVLELSQFARDFSSPIVESPHGLAASVAGSIKFKFEGLVRLVSDLQCRISRHGTGVSVTPRGRNTKPRSANSRKGRNVSLVSSGVVSQ